MSPKPVPSHFTYQTQDTVQDLPPDLSEHPNPIANYLSTQERYRQSGRVYLELRYCRACNNQ